MIVLSFLFITYLPNLGESDELNACYRKKNGKLRVVEDLSQCKRKEHQVTLLTGQDNGDEDNGDEDYEYLTDQLACVTGYIVHGSENTCEEIYSQVDNDFSAGDFCGGITNKQNITVGDFNDVFTIKSAQNHWGLSCNSDNDWVNTGCIQNLRGEPVEMDNTDLGQNSNGCFSYDEALLDSLAIGVTCCKIIKEKDEYNITELISKLREDFENHTHIYLTGKGNGHNNTSADTSSPEF